MCYGEYECSNQRRWASDRYVWAWETTYQGWAQDMAAVWAASVEAAGSLQAAQISEGAAAFGRGLLDAMPGSYYMGQAQMALHEGDYLTSGVFFLGAIGDAAAVLGPGSALATGARVAVRQISNAVPSTLARVMPGKGPFPTLGPPGRSDVFVTAADDIAGLTPAQISQKLGISASDTFTIVRFPTPQSGLASPVNRLDPGFIGGGRTVGGAREFVVPNSPIPPNAVIEVLGP